MFRTHRWRLVGPCLALLLVIGCAAPGAPRGTDASSQGPAAPKRITIAIRGNPHVAAAKLNIGNNFIGTSQLERLANAGLLSSDPEGSLFPLLAEAVPTVENGLWKLLPEGRMETTWRLKPNLRWHDGVPLTAEDVAFAARVEQDRELAMTRNPAYESVDRVEAPDPRTVTIHWKRPFVDADSMFSTGSSRALPLPKHLLEMQYEQNRTAFTQSPYWNLEFVGSGPFKIREWAPDSYIVLEAFPDYVLGRPKLDEIEIRMLPDTNTVVANILAGAVDLTVDGRSIPFEEGREAQAQWRGGRLLTGTGGVVTIYPQYLNANPAVVTDVRFRRALMHGMNRQEMVDTIQGGLAEVAHSWLGPGQREYPLIEPSLVKYDHDSRRALQLLEEIGYSRAVDGSIRDAGNQRVSFNLHTTITAINQKATLAVADNWQKLGLAVETPIIPLQRQSDQEFMFTLPAFHLIRVGRNLTAFNSLHSRQVAIPENNFAGSNRGRYRNPELDVLIDRYFETIPMNDRMQVVGQVYRHVTDQLVLMWVLFDPEANMVSNRLQNVTSGGPWNAHEWELAS